MCDDATFLRRVTLDIAGRLPTEEEAKAFLANTDADKRDQVIDELLRSPDYADYFASKWTAVLKNRRDDASDIVSNFAFHAWVRDSLLANKPYDQFVRELLAATGTVDRQSAGGLVQAGEGAASSRSRTWRSSSSACACSVPSATTTRSSAGARTTTTRLAAFFSQVGRKPSATRGEDLIFHKRGMAAATNMKTGAAAEAGGARRRGAGDRRRTKTRGCKLADWMSAQTNPFFAKSLVNRYWKHFFQRGLIEPEDDIRDTNPPTNPELLAALEKHFIAQRLRPEGTGARHHAVARLPVERDAERAQRRRSAELLALLPPPPAGRGDARCDRPAWPARRPISRTCRRARGRWRCRTTATTASSPFLRVFGRPEGASVCECERVQSSSLAQSLHLINAADIKGKLAQPKGRAERLAKDGQAGRSEDPRAVPGGVLPRAACRTN